MPTVLVPPNGATNQPAALTLKVGRTADASRYQWQISTLPSFTTFFANDSTADTTYAGQFTGGQTFYVRVRGVNDLGASAFSAVDTFTIMSPPARTTLVSPANNAVNVVSDSVVFVWRWVNTAASYNLQLSTVNSTTTYSGITDTTYKVRNLAKLTNYTWKVEAINPGGTSYFTGANAFTTIVAAPAAPAPTQPSANASGVSRRPKFSLGPGAECEQVSSADFRHNRFLAHRGRYGHLRRHTLCPCNSSEFQYRLLLADVLRERWRLQRITSASRLFTTGTTSVEDPVEAALPTMFALNQNYPNPFNPSTTISFDVPKSALVNIVIYDILGRVVTTLVNEVRAPNRYNIVWNASNVSTGVYFYRMTAKNVDGSGDFNAVKKLLLVK